jgi:hypothetical protein
MLRIGQGGVVFGDDAFGGSGFECGHGYWLKFVELFGRGSLLASNLSNWLLTPANSSPATPPPTPPLSVSA